MSGFEGDLLIGGMRLQNLQCELEEEWPEAQSDDWLLAGRLCLCADEQNLLELGRRYRLQLQDGRGAEVVISRIDSGESDRIVAEFKPAPTVRPR